ncbi:MAG: Anaphase-promoting complex, cyclosome, subunit 3 [Clostridia bacterium]|jgi:tetratricopeptide (TPR) repeat protein|nr:Anaphase-promoting complex, cyclosome, subunit 3 [Clostridia bacterium]
MMRIKKGIVLILTAVLLAGCAAQSTADINAAPTEESSSLLKEATLLVNDYKYQEAVKKLEDNYEAIKNDDKALEYYAFLEGYIYRDYDKAEKLMKRAIELNPASMSHYAVQGLLYEGQNKYKAAINSYKKALKLTDKPQKGIWNAEMSLSYTVIANCYRKLHKEKDALLNYENAVKYNPYNIEANTALHQLYVKNEEYHKAYEIWKTDNYVDEKGKSPYSQIEKWNEIYKTTLSEQGSKPSHIKMAELFGNMVLYDEAKQEYEKALKENPSDTEVKNKISELDVYIAFREQFEAQADEYYRRRCINGSKEDLTFYRSMEPAYTEIAKLFPDYTKKTGSAQSWINRLNREIEKKFNVRIQAINANGKDLGVHFGRIIDVSEVHSELFGKKADLRTITLKNMVSNGLDYWRYTKNGGVGGWNISRSEVVKVIQDRGSLPIMCFAFLYDKDYRAQTQEKAAEHDKGLNIEGKAPLDLYYSNILANEMNIRQIDIESDKLKDKKMSVDEIYRYLFLNYDKEVLIESTTNMHESQHAIDSISGAGAKWLGEVEYRPKLAELAYSDWSFSVLASLYTPYIDSDIQEVHIQADKRIIGNLVQHIYDNPSKYPEIDTSKNILSQITKLDDDDLREIAFEIFYKDYPEARKDTPALQEVGNPPQAL